VDRILRPVHRWVWGDFGRRVRKLLAFADVEGDGGRDILRAAEVTPDPLLRRLYLAHAIDELRHAELFRQRGAALLRSHAAPSTLLSQGSWLPAGDHGIDDLRVEDEPDDRLLAFLHVAEKAAAGRFTIYRDVVQDDPSTRAVFEEILRDEVFHMNYTYTQLARISPEAYRRRVWRARASRLWKRYLRVAAALAGVIGTMILTIQYFIVLAPFAWLARRAANREPRGWSPIPPGRRDSPTSQY
jgi:rubrerythrin